MKRYVIVMMCVFFLSGSLLSDDIIGIGSGDGVDIYSEMEVCNTLMIGPIEIDCSTGKVTIEDGTTLDEASIAFWEGVESVWPYLFDKKGGE